MCGIVGYIGNRRAVPILIKGLERLEYRGYDSAGLALHQKGVIEVFKKRGKVANLKQLLSREKNADSTIGIAHTRWATHGKPSDVNSHPHLSNGGSIVVVHNGIIENYQTLKQVLKKRGYVFKSETDTEVISNLIEEIQNGKISTFDATRIALSKVTGAYGLAILAKNNSDQLIVARKGSPIVIGIGDGEFFVASDASPIIEYTKKVIYLDDGDIAALNRDGTYIVKSIKNKTKNPKVHKLELDLNEIEKGGFEHFMLKEIFEQPNAIEDSIRGRLNIKNNSVLLGGIKDYENRILSAKRIVFVACGTSWHAALTGKYFIEELARINVEVEYASEFRYRNPIITKDDVVIAISQSGETADTLAAIQIARERGATVLGICNVVGSSITRITHAGVYTHAGHEIGVASTKAFTTQLSVLLLLAIRFGSLNKNLSKKRQKELLIGLSNIPKLIKSVLKEKNRIFRLATSLKSAKDVFYLGRGYGFPTALEGALKLKEVSYIHAEGYPAAEMKHGPIALIDKRMPTIFIATKGKSLDKVLSNMQEMKSRGSRVIAISTEGDKTILSISKDVITTPGQTRFLLPS